MEHNPNGSMKSKANALLLCTLMIASALAGCAGEDTDGDGVPDAIVLGCTYEGATNYNANATVDDESCTFAVETVTETVTETVYNNTTTTVEVIVGCMDATASNYNSEATQAGSCDFTGCTDADATNYNAAATIDDGSCDFDQDYYIGQFAAGSISLDQAKAALQNERMCRDDALNGVDSACEIVAITSDIDPPMMDPADAYDTSSGAVIENVYDTLYRYEASAAGTPILVPRLALSHTVSADGLTYTFTLRDNVFFSNGEAFDAEDVRYSWCRVIEYNSPDSGVAYILRGALGTDCTGLVVNPDETFSATLPTANSAFLAKISFWLGAVVDKGTCEANRIIVADDPATTDVDESSDDYCNTYLDNNPIGTNAYLLGSYVEEQEIVLEPNWLYWEQGNFNLNKITRSEVAEESTRVASLKNGDVDFGAVSVDQIDEVCDNTDTPSGITGNTTLGIDCGPENSLTVALMALKTDPTCETDTNSDGEDDDCHAWMGNGAVRKALSHIYDYQTAIDDVFNGYAIPLYGPIPTGMPFVETQQQMFTYDLAAAASILDAAGFTCDDHDSDTSTDCQRFGGDVLRMYYNTGNTQREQNAALMSQNLDQVGIANSVTGIAWGDLLDRMFGSKNWDLIFMGWAPDYLDPDNYWFPFTASAAVEGDVYNTGYSNPAVDALLEEAQQATDYATRAQKYEQAHDLYMEEPSLIFQCQYLSYHVHSDRVSMPKEVPPATIPWFNVDKS